MLVTKEDPGGLREKLERNREWASVMAKLEDEEGEGFFRTQGNTFHAPLNGAHHWSEGEDPPVKVVADGTDVFVEEEPDVSSDHVQDPWGQSDVDYEENVRRMVDGHPVGAYMPKWI